MTTPEKVEARRLEAQQPEIRDALRVSTTAEAPPPVARTADRLWFVTYCVVALALAGLYVLFGANALRVAGRVSQWGQRLALGGFGLVLVFLAARAVKVYWVGQVQSPAARHNLGRVINLLIAVAALLIALTVLLENWYTAAVSLGLISLILGFALQTPITSFIGWIYLLVRQPYKVGDRIMIGSAKGDVIDVSYLDTTLWEFGGPYLSTEHPSGRIIKFPNSLVLSETVYNYSWPLFPYIWSEVKLKVAYTSDLAFVADTMRAVVEDELGRDMEARVKVYCELLARTPVDELEIQGRPVVHFRTDDYSWIDAIVRYLVHPKESGRVKTRLLRKLLERLNAEPERVRFPKDNLR
jgi:small-conductance mechanosensitive channel